MVLTLAFSPAPGEPEQCPSSGPPAAGMLRGRGGPGGPQAPLLGGHLGVAINNSGDEEDVSSLSACLQALKGKGLGSAGCRMRPWGVNGNAPFLLLLPSRLEVLSLRWGVGMAVPSLHPFALT